MIPLIFGGMFIATGMYLLDDAKSKNSSAKREYRDETKRSKSKLKKSYSNAQRRDTLDKLFKIKKAKQKIADTIYSELKNTRNNYSIINTQLKESKYTLDNLFHQMSYADKPDMRRVIQQNIDIVVESRKELFQIKNNITMSLNDIKDRLKNANMATAKVQKSINHET